MMMLILIILLLTAYRMFMNSRTPECFSFDPGEVKILEWIHQVDSGATEGNKRQLYSAKASGFPDCKPFDPNTCSAGEWQQLGLSEKQAGVLIRYVSRGGRFKSLEELRKIYVLPEGFVDHIATCVEINEQKSDEYISEFAALPESPNNPKNNGFRVSEADPLDLNTADTIALRRIPGIGPYFARKIFQYREKLGGYHDLTQLLEIYRMTPSRLDSIRPFLALNDRSLRMMDINTITYDELATHPYISRREASGLIAYREKHGKFLQPEDLLNCKALDEKTFYRLRIYLDVR